jgi:hypothetical protein
MTYPEGEHHLRTGKKSKYNRILVGCLKVDIAPSPRAAARRASANGTIKIDLAMTSTFDLRILYVMKQCSKKPRVLLYISVQYGGRD